MPPSSPDPGDLSRLAHEMSNSLAYVTTNLNLLAEELDCDGRLSAIVADALEGAERLADEVRELRRLGWATDDTSVQAAVPRPAAAPSRILVVDDEPAILVAVERVLRRHEVVTVDSAAAAWERLSAEPFDVVLCDLVMPEETGIELFQRVSGEKPDLASRFVFMTAGGFTSRTRAFLAETRNPVLHKPFDAKTLRWVVAQHIHSAAAVEPSP
ncbi:MAG: response regulator [Myxococcales bacterium]|nr:response regulator [Myxococcales bacterium]